MRPIVVFCLILGPAFTVAQEPDVEADRQTLRIVSFNVRFGTANDGENRWELRKSVVVQAIREMNPDVMGTQEMQRFQAEYLQEQLPEYQYIGKSRVPHDENGEECGIFFRRDRLNNLEQGHFWLSESPDVPGSKSWDSSLPRMATWVKLYDERRKERLLVVNTHFDHRGREARHEAARLLRRRALALRDDLPCVITGDFNCGEDSEPYKALLGLEASEEETTGVWLDTYRQTNPDRNENEGTFNGFQGRRQGARIDWIVAAPGVVVKSAEIVTYEDEGRYPSDHFPVSAELDW